MSNDTIYREDAIEAIHREARIVGGSVAIEYADMFQDAIKALPSADRPQGEWIVSDDKYFHTCQFCNADVDMSMGTGIFVDNDEVSHMNYCPNCGCAMTKE